MAAIPFPEIEDIEERVVALEQAAATGRRALVRILQTIDFGEVQDVRIQNGERRSTAPPQWFLT